MSAKAAQWLDPDHIRAQVDDGTVLASVGELRAAEAKLKLVLRTDPQNGDALENLGLLYLKKALSVQAAEKLRQLTELDETRASAYFYLGEALSRLDDVDPAVAAFKRSLELQPDSVEALYKLGILYDRKLQPELAEPVYREARELRKR